ncbi:MAG: SOS response-associated peptidase family protein [Sphingomonas sp.]|uniref:SOS response-associated peptidase family protein n=1 Tax=Sphingomonas sp. TaxID=28214 RepID=UPI00262498F3|nr:SOS response-associated peptidase family protein [Sphingomonas sp.]MDK2768094.1 SOS response-associated peptidase family protein [Sphingomonas sp.]
MKASPFESEAALGTRRPIIRRNPDNAQEVEMVEAGWGLQPWDGQGTKPFKFIRSEGKTFPTHRCLIPASEFQVKNGDRRFRVTLEDGNWFYLAGVWRPANPDWPMSFAVVTIEANPDVFFYQERQGAVLLRRQNMAWLDLSVPQEELLQPLPPRSFTVTEIAPRAPELRQAELSF